LPSLVFFSLLNPSLQVVGPKNLGKFGHFLPEKKTLLLIETLQNHFIFYFLVFTFSFEQNIADKGFFSFHFRFFLIHIDGDEFLKICAKKNEQSKCGN